MPLRRFDVRLAAAFVFFTFALSGCEAAVDAILGEAQDAGQDAGSCLLTSEGGAPWSCVSWPGSEDVSLADECATLGSASGATPSLVSSCPEAESFIGCCFVSSAEGDSFQECFYRTVLDDPDASAEDAAELVCTGVFEGTWVGGSALVVSP